MLSFRIESTSRTKIGWDLYFDKTGAVIAQRINLVVCEYIWNIMLFYKLKLCSLKANINPRPSIFSLISLMSTAWLIKPPLKLDLGHQRRRRRFTLPWFVATVVVAVESHQFWVSPLLAKTSYISRRLNWIKLNRTAQHSLTVRGPLLLLSSKSKLNQSMSSWVVAARDIWLQKKNQTELHFRRHSTIAARIKREFANSSPRKGGWMHFRP